MNNGTAPFEFVRGQRIAQLILERIFVLPVEEVEAVVHLVSLPRGLRVGALSAVLPDHTDEAVGG